ncbi:MAG: hypothetical protein HGB17_02520 [Syntrophobacteraceae bacterium]|nr:hypothetical protein [Syntrophobacteraceae bacterium]
MTWLTDLAAGRDPFDQATLHHELPACLHVGFLLFVLKTIATAAAALTRDSRCRQYVAEEAAGRHPTSSPDDSQ